MPITDVFGHAIPETSICRVRGTPPDKPQALNSSAAHKSGSTSALFAVSNLVSMTSNPYAAPSPWLLRVACILATAGLSLLIAILTLNTQVNVPSNFALNDKVYHIAAFGALILPTAILQPRWAPRVGLGVLVYGGIIELIQPSFGRSAAWLDFLANSVGIFAGLILGTLLLSVARRVRARLA